MSPERVLHIAACWGHMDPAALRGPSRRYPIARLRMAAIRLCREYCEPTPSYEALGQVFGGRDRTTISHACRRAAVPAGLLSAVRAAAAPPTFSVY